MWKTNTTSRTLLVIGALTTWLAVLLQLYLIIVNRQASVGETIVRFFSFFTILTNILVALCFIFLLLPAKSALNIFFSKPNVLSAVTVYITVVGLVYNVILRFLWAPQGLQMIVDELLHSVVPIIFILYWSLFVPKENLKWKDAFPWLIYPAGYLIFILFRGAFSGFYPYPFVHVNELGYTKVFINCIFLFITFLVLSFLLIWISKLVANRSRLS